MKTMADRYAWYMDNRFYFSQQFADSLIQVVEKLRSSGEEIEGRTLKKYFTDDENPGSRLTVARDFGLLNIDGSLGDSALMYSKGFLSYKEFMLELLIKRNTKKDASIQLKPVVLLCKAFSIMDKLQTSIDERFLTTNECYEYLSPLESYDELTEDLINSIIEQRTYPTRGKHIPIPRMQIDSGAVYLSSIFNCLNDTPMFYFGEQKSVLFYNRRYLDFIRYIAEHGDKISIAPPAQGSQKKNEPYYKYMCDMSKGLYEIIPKLNIEGKIPSDLIGQFYRFIFGSKGDFHSLSQICSNEIYGIFRPFASIRTLVLSYIYLDNNALGEQLFDYHFQCVETKEMEEHFMRLPFSDTAHTKFSASQFLTPAWFADIGLRYEAYEEECQALLSKFRDRYSPAVLKSKSGEELLRYVFKSDIKSTDYLAKILDKGGENREYSAKFGSSRVGNEYHFGLYYDDNAHSWVTGSIHNPVPLSLQGAIEQGKEIVDRLCACAQICEKYSSLETLDEYESFVSEIRDADPDRADYLWVTKYLYLLYPNLFATYYNDDWQRFVLCVLGIEPHSDSLMRHGQIALFVKECKISTAVFSKIMDDEIGSKLTVFRVGTGHDGNNYFSEWVANKICAIGWNYLGELSQYEEEGKLSKTKITDILKEKSGYNPSKASAKYREINNFYTAEKDKTIVLAMNGQKILGIGRITGDYKYNPELSGYCHTRTVEWTCVISDEVTLPETEGLLTSFTEITKGKNLCFIFGLYFGRDTSIQLASATVLEEKDETIDYDNAPRITGGENIILYGVPGAGKSWTIKNEYCSDDDCMERLVFHPDYTYSDFVGQIMPKVDEKGGVTYEFTPGPFTELVRKAYRNPEKMFYLVIEEVNRGNAPAIFGDIFQLLDRQHPVIDGIENPKYGASEYAITNADIARVVYGNASHGVSIPSNMSILCTMNTSDQNVFTLDTAFQRRWSMRLISNEFGDAEGEQEFAATKILDTDVTWQKFFTEVNTLILNKNIRMTSSEDKRLGTHFVSQDDLRFDPYDGDDVELLKKANRQNRRFAEKVLKYLWDDAFKFNKDEIFDLSKVNSLEKVIKDFVSASGNERFKKIFKEGIANLLIPRE